MKFKEYYGKLFLFIAIAAMFAIDQLLDDSFGWISYSVCIFVLGVLIYKA